jgi:hypothetical protein
MAGFKQVALVIWGQQKFLCCPFFLSIVLEDKPRIVTGTLLE